MARQQRITNGFTLIEVMLAVTIVLTALIAIVGVFVLAQKMVVLNWKKEFASSYAQTLIEQTRSMPFASLTNGSIASAATNSVIPVTVNANQIIVDGPLTGLKQVTIDYQFSHRGKIYRNYLVSYATDGGLND